MEWVCGVLRCIWTATERFFSRLSVPISGKPLLRYNWQVSSKLGACRGWANYSLPPPQADQCRKLSASLQSQSPEHLLPVLIQAAQLCREKQHAKAIGPLQVGWEKYSFGLAPFKLALCVLCAVILCFVSFKYSGISDCAYFGLV